MKGSFTSILNSLQPANIFEPEVFSQIKYQAYFLMENKDIDEAANFARDLQNILSETNPQNEKENNQLNVLFFFLYRLKLFAFPNLNQQEQVDIFKHEILPIMSFKLDIKEAILNYTKVLNDPENFKKVTQNFLFALTENDSMLGDSKNFAKVKFSGKIKDWLMEYRQSLASKGAEIQDFGTFHVLNFLNTNQNVKFLSKEEIETLKELFELYNWLNDPIVYIEKENTQSVSNFLIKQKFTLPQQNFAPDIKTEPKNIVLPSPVKKIDINEILSKGSGVRLGNQQDTGNSKLEIGKLKNAEDIGKLEIGEQGQRIPPVVPAKQVTSESAERTNRTNLTPAPFGAGQADRANTTEDLNQIRLEIEKKKQMAQAQIDKRLESLKNRKGNN